MGDSPHKRTEEELRAALDRQLKHMQRSMEAYDAGALEEGERLASVAYILLHDGKGKTKSLLSRLGIRDRLGFPDSRQRASVAGTGLATPILRGDEIVFIPTFAGSRNMIGECQRIPFQDWWRQPLFGSDGKITRRDLVLSLRDQDGGGHVDHELDNVDYVNLKGFGVRGLSVKDGVIYTTLRVNYHETPPPLPYGPQAQDAHWASMRQMAYEIELALRESSVWLQA